MRKPSLRTLSRKLDKVFSQYIRRRDCDEKGIGKCITCGTVTLLQAGHFIGRTAKATRWLSDNCHGQCPRCNCWGYGEQALYYQALVKKLGHDRVNELMRLRRTTVKFSREELQAMIDRFSV